MGGSPKTPKETTQVVKQDTIPEYLQPFVSDVAARAQAISRQPYQPFQGQRIADFSEAQRTAMDQVGQLGRPEQLGQASQTYTDIGQAVGTTKAGTFDQAAAEQYMSPYQQAVTDIAIRKAQEEAQRQQGLSALGAAGRGTAGGSRQAVMDAIRLRGLTDTVGDIQARGSQQAFSMAQQQFERDRQARLAQAERDRRAQFGVASGLAGLGQLQQQTDLQRLAAQQKVGAAEQALEQRQLDTAYADFLRQRDFPKEQLAFYSNLIRGLPAPLSSTQITYGQPAPLGQQLAGLGIAGLGLAGEYGG
jgi:virulence-associated protein VapD